MIEPGTARVPTGYEHPSYAASLSEFGSPMLLPLCQGWALMRRIPGSSQSDVLGTYPLFFCRDWSQLQEDVAALRDRAVSFAMVTDPFAKPQVNLLSSSFDIVIPFKDHFIVELSRPLEYIVSKSHQETVRRARKKVTVSLCANPADRLAEWLRLFGYLVKRHQIGGIKAFSAEAFAQQLRIPGITVFEAREIATGELVGMEIWYLQNDVAYGHLAAFSERGYALRASYASKWQVLCYFSDKARYVNLGGKAGTDRKQETVDGLTRFKQGWSTGTLKAYFCGKILDPASYAQLVRDKGAEGVRFFPSYRNGEF